MNMVEKRKIKIPKSIKPYQKELFSRYPSYKSNLDTMKLLTTSTLFQEIVKDCRAFLEIPENGLPIEDKIMEEWSTKMDTKSEEKILNEAFWRQIKKIGVKIQNDEIDEPMAKKQKKLIQETIPWNRLKYDIDYLLETFKLPLNFDESIRRYIVHSEISAPLSNFSVGPFPIETNFKDGPLSLPVTIYGKLTNKELKRLKKQTESYLGRKLPKYDDLKDIDMEIELDKWNRHKEKFDEVEQKEYKMTAEEIAENLLGDKKKAQQVYDSTRKLKKLRKQRFGIE